ncbi:hypothetical protein ACG873_19385 [Mesorhizobium sp. AaZ16]|uniref:hypothetical protein n=1 Tax=Mesorhizobium sp. AaZ16 TaxID=3402289 RepID=UPI00374EC2DF
MTNPFRVAVALGTLFLASPAFANDGLVPLNQLPMNDLDNLLYMVKRCGAVSFVMATKFREHDEDMSNRLLKQRDHFSDKAFQVVVAMSNNTGKEVKTEDINLIVEDIVKLVYLYRRHMEDSYIKSGKMIDNLTMSDSQLCISAYESDLVSSKN